MVRLKINLTIELTVKIRKKNPIKNSFAFALLAILRPFLIHRIADFSCEPNSE